MIKLGSQEVTKIMKGSQEVTTAYKGGDEVWSSVKSPEWMSTVCLIEGSSFSDKTGIHFIQEPNGSSNIWLNQVGPTPTGSIYIPGGSKGSYATFARKSESTFEADFTIEFWVKVQSTSGVSYPCVFSNMTTFGTGSIGLYASHRNGYSGGFSLALDGRHPVGGNIPYTVHQWCHIAIVRKGTAMRTFKDGNRASASYSSSSAIGSGSNHPNWAICNSLNTPGQSGVDMYIADFRMVKDIAVYWDNFTPPGQHPTSRSEYDS